MKTTVMGRKIGGCARFGKAELGPHLTQIHNVAGAKAYFHAKFHFDPPNRLAAVRQRHRLTDRQLYASIGRTVLQTVVQKQLN